MLDERRVIASEVKGLIMEARSDLMEIMINCAFDNIYETPEKLKPVYELLDFISEKCKKEETAEDSDEFI